MTRAEEILNKNRANVLESMEEYASIKSEQAVREERERIKREIEIKSIDDLYNSFTEEYWSMWYAKYQLRNKCKPCSNHSTQEP